MSDDNNEQHITKEEQEEIEERQPLRAAMVHEIIREQGLDELNRSTSALWWSGVAAGLSMGLSMLTTGMLAAHLPHQPWAELITKFGYCSGFLIVILARQQLFTENTITALLPVIAGDSRRYFPQMIRLWGTVLAANVMGTLLFALAMVETPAFDAPYVEAALDVSRKMISNDPWAMFTKGVVAGWLIAGLVWLLPSAEGSKFWVIIFVTYLIALGDFTHIVAGSAEAFSLLFIGEQSLGTVVLGFFLPTLAGNVIGGSVIFSVITYAQVREEIQ